MLGTSASSYNIQHATNNMQHATNNMQHATNNMQHATCNTLTIFCFFASLTRLKGNPYDNERENANTRCFDIYLHVEPSLKKFYKLPTKIEL